MLKLLGIFDEPRRQRSIQKGYNGQTQMNIL